MENILRSVFSFVFVFTLAALSHELGHFLAAKLSGMEVEEFALGFGKRLFARKRGGTVYAVNLIPILGYVKIKGMDSDYDNPKGFAKQSLLKRFITIFAGPFMNFVLAFLIFIVVFSSYGNPFMPSTTIGEIMQSSPAEISGLQKSDKILVIDNTKITSWEQMVSIIRENPDKPLVFEVEREKEILKIIITPILDKTAGYAVIGVYPAPLKMSIFESITSSFKWTLDLTYKMFTAIPKIFTKEGISSITGPIGIAKITSEAAKYGILNLLWFAAILSINLGLINLFPFPALDGGWLAFLVFELITRKRVPPEKEGIVQTIGFVILLSLMFIVSLKDIVGLFK